LAAGRGEKSIPDAYMNTVVATRNLLDAAVQQPSLKRFVCVSSFSVYSNGGRRPRRILDETSPVELRPERRGDAYCFAKVGQEEIVNEYRRATGVPTVVMRPGWVYGPGNEAISGRVGIGTFGLFLHLGGGNTLPLSYVDNCADAIVLGGLAPGIQGEVFNIVDDDMPSSRSFLRMYKANVRRFPSLYVPHAASYLLCYLWEKYSEWSSGQLPPVFNRTVWRAYWRPTRYSNDKIKKRVGWRQRVSTEAALNRYFAACRTGGSARPS
jgi:nucleoside-diphosphate-sugar epimerase